MHWILYKKRILQWTSVDDLPTMAVRTSRAGSKLATHVAHWIVSLKPEHVSLEGRVWALASASQLLYLLEVAKGSSHRLGVREL